MGPIFNQVYNHDSVRYVYQDPNIRITCNNVEQVKPFEPNLDKADKTKKDLKKQKDHKDKSKDKDRPFNLR